MKTFKGTKGEWEVSKVNPKIVLNDMGAYRPNAMMLSICSKAEMMANAKLIAAAPELLEALERCKKSMAIADEVEFSEEIEQAKKAINKAL